MSILHPPLQRIKDAFLLSYTRAELLQYFYPYVCSTLQVNYELFRNLGFTASQITDYAKLKNPPKEALAEATAMVFCHEDGYRSFLKVLPDEQRAMWELLKDYRRISHVALLDQHGREMIDPGTPLGFRMIGQEDRYVHSDFRIFFKNRRLVQGKYLFYFSLPELIRKLTLSYYPLPEKAALTPVKNVAGKLNLYEQSDTVFLSEWPRILSGWRNQLFSYTVKGRPTSLIRTANSIKLKEFFPDADTRYRLLRTQLVAGLFASVDPRKMPESGLEAIQYLFREIYHRNAFTAPWVLTDIKGLGKLKNSDFVHTESGMFSLLQALPTGQWVASERLFQFAEFSGSLTYPLMSVAESLNLERADADKNPSPLIDRTIHAEIDEQWILRQMLNGSMFLFSAFGLLDLAYGAPDPGKAPPWNSLAYVRRTPLGDHVTGHRQDYQPEITEEESRPIFSEEGLLITLPDDNHPTAELLSPYAERIGVGKYQASAPVFLKGIRNKKELQARMRMFLQVAGEELPEQWQHFLQDLEGKVNPLVPMPELLVYQIRPDDKAMIQHFGKDPVLREIAVKAEGFRVLVHRSKLNDLRKRLRELGYLMP